MTAQNLLGFCLDYPDTTSPALNKSRTASLSVSRELTPTRFKKEYPMNQIAAHASFTLDSLFVASARRARKAAVPERETPARGFASHLEAARSQHQPMSSTKRESPDRSEEDPERW